MKYIKRILLIIFIFFATYTSYKYFIYSKVFNSVKLEKLSNDLAIPILNYISQFEKEDLANPKKFKKMVKWVKDNYSVIQEYDELLNYGYEIKYHEKSDFYLLYLYGEDKKSSTQNISIKGIDEEGLFSVQKPSFLKYLFGSSDYDIVLFGYKTPPARV